MTRKRKVAAGLALAALTSAAMSMSVAQAAPLAGAIFTTTPDGGIVNENVRYESKLEVYLDGGPGPNAPQTAAGLPDGMYVFQITDPSGWVLLSDDPSKCRVIEVANGIIVRLVLPTELDFSTNDYYKPGNGNNGFTLPCHVPDPPDGAAGASGHHDTNTDRDYGNAGAIVVQMMPFLDTPNPGGVYKAWVTPLDVYKGRLGNLGDHPDVWLGTVKKRGQVLGYKNDPGFGPPRSVQKTDNFKVKEQPPMIHVFKFHDLDGDGIKDADEPEIEGWEVTIRETLYDGTYIENTCYTPCSKTVAQESIVTVTESASYMGEGWEISYVLVDGQAQIPAARSVDVPFAAGDLKHVVKFGNFKLTPKSGIKCKDLKADGRCDADDPKLPGWTIKASGTAGKGTNFTQTKTTDSDGAYRFDLPPGTYMVEEVCPTNTDWYQSLPKPSGYVCGNGRYTNIEIRSGDAPHLNNDFGNFQPVQIIAKKFNDLDADGVKDAGEDFLKGVKFCLLQGGAEVDSSDFLKMPQDACQVTDSYGTVKWENLFPNEYTVDEEVPVGAFPTATEVYIGGKFYTKIVGSGADKVALPFLVGCADKGHAELTFGDGFKCVGLTPGYWSNWRNHYTEAEFLSLLSGTIAGSIDAADELLNSNSCSDGNAIDCMRKFLLANQLTLNLTAAIADGRNLFNGDDAGLSELCQVPGYTDSLGYWLGKALSLHQNPPNGNRNRDYILTVKTMLDRFANMNLRP